MKKKFLCSTLAMAMAASMLFGCASESKTETTAAAGETTAAAAETTAEAAKAETNGEKLKVTLLVTGSFGDKAFNDSAQAGMEKLEAELGDKVEVNMVEMGSDKTKFEGSMLDACESDADLIITGLWDMKEITEKVAQEFPEKKFIIFDTDVDYTLGDLSNVYSMSYKQNEGAFLAGVLAASATKSDMEYANEDNVIGFVGAKDTAAVINDSAVGFIEGAQFVAKFGILSFITTLGMGTVLDGVIYGLTGGTTVFHGIPKAFTIPGILKIAGIPFITIVAAVLYIVFHMFMNHMSAGRKLYAIGGSKEAAETAGIRIFRYRILAFALSAAMAGLAGALVASRVGSANTTAGQGYFLQSYAAVFIGCTVSKSGVPCVVGTLVGTIILAVLANGLTILQMPSFMQNIITGGIIILAVVLQKLGAGHGSR